MEIYSGIYMKIKYFFLAHFLLRTVLHEFLMQSILTSIIIMNWNDKNKFCEVNKDTLVIKTMKFKRT